MVSNSVGGGGYFSNGVLYLHEWFELSDINVGCHIGGVFAGGFIYTDDLKLLTSAVHPLRILAHICEKCASNF